jgi:WS/DGAT/MGAT family acyltransferase
MKQRLVEIPLGLDLPYWIDDPDFDLDFHIRHVAVPPPGDHAQLAALVGRLIGRPLDRARPLWELNVIESIEGGDVALLVKTHHAAVDGRGGAELLTTLLDTEREGREIQPPAENPMPSPVPDSLTLLQKTYASMASSPQRLVRAQQNALRSVGELFVGLGPSFDFSPFAELRNAVGLAESQQVGVQIPAVPAPTTPFNSEVSGHRRIAWRSVPLEMIRTIKNNAETTFNDVVVAICSGGLRRYLLRRDALPERPIVALIPITVRGEHAHNRGLNRVSGTVVEIATDEGNPELRLARIHQELAHAKGIGDAIPAAEVIENLSDFAPTSVACLASRMVASLRIADRAHPPLNLAISNIAGPRDRLFTAGAPLKALIPALPVSDGLGLSISTVSFGEQLDLCLVSCRELVPDLEELADDLVAAFRELEGARRPTPRNVRRRVTEPPPDAARRNM